MNWEKGEAYACTNPSCGAEVVVTRSPRRPRNGHSPICSCGAVMARRA